MLKPLLSSIVLFIVKLPAFPIAPPTDFEPDNVIVLFKRFKLPILYIPPPVCAVEFFINRFVIFKVPLLYSDPPLTLTAVIFMNVVLLIFPIPKL